MKMTVGQEVNNLIMPIKTMISKFKKEVADAIEHHLNAIHRLETKELGSDELIEKYADFLGYELSKSYNFIPKE